VTPNTTPSGDLDIAAGIFDVERSTRYAALAGLVAYALGLVIVNMYLFQIGVSDFAVLRTRFVLTGALALLTFAGIGAFAFTGMLAVSAFKAGRPIRQGQPTRRAKVNAILTSEVLMFALISLLAATLIVPWLNASGIRIRASLLGSLFYGGDLVYLIAMTIVGIILNSLAKPFVGEAPQDFAERPLWHTGLFLVTAFLIGAFVFFSIDFFASTIYPVIPEQFGGGRPKQVRIVMSPDRSDVGTALGFGPTTDGPMVRQVDLLWETEQMYVVRDDAQPDSPVIQIDRDAVSAVVLGSGSTPAATPNASPVVTP
jgi:hypothetical protein